MMTLQSKQRSEIRSQKSAQPLASSPEHRVHFAVRRGFSLVEVLLSIFILGVGVISIAALFPAGIAQQRMSVDDSIGPIVANNALAVLRSKLSPDDFGNPSFTLPGGVPGDTFWLRPAFYGLDPTLSAAEAGISIFMDADTDTEIDFYNTFKYATAPDIRITQGERYYPMVTLKDPNNPAAGFVDGVDHEPQYVWDCMFRKFQGKVLVAIYVYRVNIPGGGAAAYKPAAGPVAVESPLPFDLVFGGGVGFSAWNPGDGSMQDPILGTTLGAPFNPDDLDQAWEEPRQWILDPYNNIHRVASAYRATDGRLMIELVRPVPQMPDLPSYLNSSSVKRIWYMPLSDANGVSITPVYLTVKEL